MPRMNGSEPRIEIFKPFGEAFELMKKILFQPFDLKKWLVIGFAAWLANFGAGGGGFGNFNYPNNRRESAQKFNETISQIPQPVLITAIAFWSAAFFCSSSCLHGFARAGDSFLLIVSFAIALPLWRRGKNFVEKETVSFCSHYLWCS